MKSKRAMFLAELGLTAIALVALFQGSTEVVVACVTAIAATLTNLTEKE